MSCVSGVLAPLLAGLLGAGQTHRLTSAQAWVGAAGGGQPLGPSTVLRPQISGPSRCSLSVPMAAAPAVVTSSLAVEGQGRSDDLLDAVSSCLNYIAKQSLDELIPQVVAVELAMTARESINMDKTKDVARQLANEVEVRIRNEQRSIGDVVGVRAADQAVKAVGDASMLLFDDSTVNMFLRSKPVEQIIGALLYDALFEFVQRADLIGNFIGTLPILGPLRQQVVSAAKTQIDRQLGDLIKSFLGEYAAPSTQRLSQLVLTAENKAALIDQNKEALRAALSKPIKSLVPDRPVTDLLIDAISTMEIPKDEDATLIENLYKSSFMTEKIASLVGSGSAKGDQEVSSSVVRDFLQEDKLPAMTPELRRSIVSGFERFVSSSEGQVVLVSLLRATLPPVQEGASADKSSGDELGSDMT